MMAFALYRKTLVSLYAILIAVCSHGLLYGQDNYHIEQYTSRDGLPQNSIRGLAFDRHGFLWLATEGGIARFNGRSFRVFNSEDHPELKNQRFTEALALNDSSILFIDLLNGMYLLSNDRFTTLQPPSSKNHNLVRIHGNPPDPDFLLRDTFFFGETARAIDASIPAVTILPLNEHQVYIVSNRIVLVDTQQKVRRIIRPKVEKGEKAALLNGHLLLFTPRGQLHVLIPETNSFEPCELSDENGDPWKGQFESERIYNTYPFRDVFFGDGRKLYSIIPTGEAHRFTISTLLHQLPENCFINEVAYRPSDQILVLGSDSRGIFIYHLKHFSNFIFRDQKAGITNAYYAQTLIDSATLLASNKLLIDIQANAAKGLFPNSFNQYLLANDDKGNIYYTLSSNIIRYNLATGQEHQIIRDSDFGTHFLQNIDGKIWLGTTSGIGFIHNDSMQWVYQTAPRSEIYGIQCLSPDDAGNLWFGSYFNLYRLNTGTRQLDSFPAMANADFRILKMIRNNLYIGTNGNGYLIYHKDRFYHMPAGRKNELSHTHNFIEDTQGYLWIPTNHGLYKTHLDAIAAYLRDTTSQIDYYVYLEDDGIQSIEFNGGCSPPHVMLPDGRLSLPTIEGLVIFKPEATPHFFSGDTMVFESIVIDGELSLPVQPINIPANHSNIKIYFDGAWYNRPENQYVSYKLEGLHQQFRLCDINQTAYTIGHLKPGKYTFVLRRRSGFGPEDFEYAKLNFTVLTPWYESTWAFAAYALGFLLVVWGTSILYARSIRQRNIELQQKVDKQTAELLSSNSQLEDNLRKLAASELNLRKNIRVRDRLISIITHDILTPLRFIGQIARLGNEDKPNDPGMAKRALTDVQNATHKLFHSTQNLLHWVSYQQEKFTTSSINCSPFALVEQLMEDFSEMSRFQGNTLINEVPEDDVIRTDPTVLNIILHNLLSNAIKYTQNGEIRVQSGVENNLYMLEVRDTGRGMTATQLDAIRQGTAKQGDTTLEDVTAGNGIGLTLVADLVRAIQGRWEIDSREGIGVSVRIFLSLDQQVQV